MIFWSVPLRELNNLIDIVIDEFENSVYNDFEEFSLNIINKFSEEFLSIWFLYKIDTKKKIYLKPDLDEKQYFKDIFEEDNIKESTKKLLNKTWNQ